MCNFGFKTAGHSLPLAFFLISFFQENKIVTAAIILYMDDKLNEEDTQWFFMSYKTHICKSHFWEDDLFQNYIVH